MLPPFDPWCTCAAAADVSVAAHASAEALRRRRSARLASLLAAAAEGSAFYRRALAGRDPATVGLEQLPIVQKRALMADFASWVTDRRLDIGRLRRFVRKRTNIAEPYLDRYTVWESSGSTGEPAIFVQDPAALAVYDALEILRRPVLRPLERWLDPWALAERTAFVGAIDGHFASTVSIERLRRLQPALADRLRCFSFLQPIDALVAELNAFAPTVLATYPSAAVLLAHARRCGRLTAAPSEIWTGGEQFSPARRAFVRDTFDCPVTHSYGASEFLSLAFECRLGVLHLNSDWAILEPVDAEGRPVPAGQAGATTLLTNLANQVQPLIRYDLGDRVALLGARCACGSPLPAIRVEGRDDDTLVLPGRPGTPPVRVVPLAISTILEEEAGLFDFQLVQQGDGDLLLRTSQHGAQAQATLRQARRKLLAFLSAQGAGALRVQCRTGEINHRGRSGKIKRVIASAQ